MPTSFRAAFLCAALCLPLLTLPLAAQSADWGRVQALKPGAAVTLKSRTLSLTCKVVAVDAESLTCGGVAAPFPRADVLKISIHRRGVSALVGFGIGAGLGAGIGAATAKPDGIGGRGLPALVFGIPVALIGGLIGALTDFTHSTIYKAP